jgi:5-methylcytosine-specific restriction endonuclease McrBC GTP-binding regulatory subunit McrB
MPVRLPSGSYFTVPPNLHIIGTMNTADRSIALLDIALRRRFKFIGKYPDYELIQDFERVLRPINEQIKIRKKSADLMIGHSFFIGKGMEQLHDIFDQEIIPLLNEYFNGNNAQITEVLQAGGIRAKEDENFQLTCERN